LYLSQYKSDAEEFYSREMMRMFQALQHFFEEPTAHEVVHAFHRLERALLFRKK
jgi:hypothetical protein